MKKWTNWRCSALYTFQCNSQLQHFFAPMPEFPLARKEKNTSFTITHAMPHLLCRTQVAWGYFGADTANFQIQVLLQANQHSLFLLFRNRRVHFQQENNSASWCKFQILSSWKPAKFVTLRAQEKATLTNESLWTGKCFAKTIRRMSLNATPMCFTSHMPYGQMPRGNWWKWAQHGWGGILLIHLPVMYPFGVCVMTKTFPKYTLNDPS